MITRFAPSPTGPLHLGHAYSAMLAHDLARATGGTFLLRIEDIDQSRARPRWEAQIYDDLLWLGLDWPEPVLRQSERIPVYEAALAKLDALGLTYRCACSRRDIAEAATAPQEGAPLMGPDGIVYPGTCKAAGLRDSSLPVRLHMDRALDLAGAFSFHESGHGFHTEIRPRPEDMLTGIGDVVLARREMGTSYHLSVTVDDAAQGVTHVVRGRDLAEATPIHVLLQTVLGLPVPVYHHHRLIRDAEGKRLAKRDDARAIALYRDQGARPEDIRRMVGLTPAQ
ncbi:tRNA glutamyl-Q(34) synthetase GluQRS [Palleronia caenipelagi]|uniref:tRNA glutamyl-Q(34) synthetase GluQRS n=1 Tax=Palleronia caenipelagi TaxID=2489174 RepID=A0A547Q619_9RHOB|nr:tRNA glutamyl-Q(34) synthetase GluQRS [Palleronia caenipelagi]TRD21833.1 tRNA glutamyl-Q(34) synthetase GluQRS [Palleronia caenipelagi]